MAGWDAFHVRHVHETNLCKTRYHTNIIYIIYYRNPSIHPNLILPCRAILFVYYNLSNIPLSCSIHVSFRDLSRNKFSLLSPPFAAVVFTGSLLSPTYPRLTPLQILFLEVLVAAHLGCLLLARYFPDFAFAKKTGPIINHTGISACTFVKAASSTWTSATYCGWLCFIICFKHFMDKISKIFTVPGISFNQWRHRVLANAAK